MDNGQILELFAIVVIIFLAVLVTILIMFWPYRIARNRGHRNTQAIFILCLFFGWTTIGWVAAMIWAVWNEKAS